jgi:hypothetical protein
MFLFSTLKPTQSQKLSIQLTPPKRIQIAHQKLEMGFFFILQWHYHPFGSILGEGLSKTFFHLPGHFDST